MTRVERAYLGKLEHGDVDFFDASIPLLLTAGRSCHDTVKARPAPGLFASEPAAFTNGFVCVRLTNSLTAWGNVICTPDCITTVVHIKDWTDLYKDLEQFASDDREKSTLLHTAFGLDDDAYDLFKRTLLKATRDSHSSEIDPQTSVPSLSSHIVIDSVAACACVYSEPPPSTPNVDRDEFLWFYNALVTQGFEGFPAVSGISRFYDGKDTPRMRMVLQKRDVNVNSQELSHVQIDNSLASVEAIRRLLVMNRHSPAASVETLPAIQEDLDVSIPYSLSDTTMPTCSSTFTCDEGVHRCIAGLLLLGWEARLFEHSETPKSVNELIACFSPEPTIIVKQRSWLLFHKGLACAMALNSSQVRYLLCRFSRVVLFDSQTNTAFRYKDTVTFRLSHNMASDALSALISNRETCEDSRPTKRLRRLLKAQ
jgi:hypothetical protein